MPFNQLQEATFLDINTLDINIAILKILLNYRMLMSWFCMFSFNRKDFLSVKYWSSGALSDPSEENGVTGIWPLQQVFARCKDFSNSEVVYSFFIK